MKSQGKSPAKVMSARTRTILYTIAAVICLAGLADTIYLTVVAFTGEAAACGNAPGCLEVLTSTYSRIGGMPISALGVPAYFAVFVFAILACFGYSRAHRFFALTVWVMFAVTLWLLYLQAFKLHAFCRYCLFSAAIVFLLAGLVVVNPAPAGSEESEDKA